MSLKSTGKEACMVTNKGKRVVTCTIKADVELFIGLAAMAKQTPPKPTEQREGCQRQVAEEGEGHVHAMAEKRRIVIFRFCSRKVSVTPNEVLQTTL